MFCKICNAKIVDFGYLIQKYGNEPQRCEKCRRESRTYRAKANIARKMLNQKIVVLGEGLIRHARLEKEKTKKSAAVYSIGGREFGPWGGAAFDEKYLVYVLGSTGTLEAGMTYDFRLMVKTDMESGKSWKYLVLEPTPVREDTPIVLDFKFTRIYKTTLKGFGRQFNDHFPIEEEHETILTGWSSARSGRFGNEWKLFIREGGEVECPDLEAEDLLV